MTPCVSFQVGKNGALVQPARRTESHLIAKEKHMGKLSGKVAIVTGASRGIGRGIARALAKEGATLVVNSRSGDALQASADEMRGYGVEVLEHAGDCADETVVEGMFAALQERFGKLDLLVNNAGTFEGGPLDELSIADWDRVMNTNLRAPFLCTRLAMRMMKQKKSGRIINIGSISAHRVRPHSAPYSTSKHGILGLTQVTALEGREYGITCGCLQPGNILTERRDASDSDVDQEPMISVDELAEVALLMATLPENVEMLEAIVLPRNQLYVGRG